MVCLGMVDGFSRPWCQTWSKSIWLCWKIHGFKCTESFKKSFLDQGKKLSVSPLIVLSINYLAFVNFKITKNIVFHYRKCGKKSPRQWGKNHCANLCWIIIHQFLDQSYFTFWFVSSKCQYSFIHIFHYIDTQ